MKRVLGIILCLCVAMLGCAGALAEATDTKLNAATLTVSGAAQVTLEADYATLTLGATTLAETVAEASATNSVAVDTILAALKEAGVVAEDVVTENFSVSPVYDYQYGKLGQSQFITGYQVENLLRVTVRDIDKVGQVLDAGMKAGANESYGITFQSTKAGAARDEALTAAISEGARKAQVMAKGCGKTLTRLVSLQEDNAGADVGVMLTYDASSAANTTILPDGLTVSAAVTMVYEME